MFKQKGITMIELSIVMSLILIMMVVLLTNAPNNSKQIANDKKLTEDKLLVWNNYKLENCQIKQKIFGTTANMGKFNYRENKEVYSCLDGIEYIVAENLDARITNGLLSADDIPTIETSKNHLTINQ